MSELPELIHSLRTAGDIWFFDPTADSHRPGLGLWFHAAPERIGEIRRALRTDDTVHLTEERVTERPPSHPGARGIDLADELAVVSSELAIALAADGSPRPVDGPAWAVRHLRHLVDLVPQRERRAFLFVCWQQWTAAMEPAQRIDLGIRAEIEGDSVPRWDTGAPAAGPWGRYTEATRAIATAPGFTADAPGNFLLFEHAHRTHVRLGLPLAVEALAARIVRSELDATGAPAAPAAPALQNA